MREFLGQEFTVRLANRKLRRIGILCSHNKRFSTSWAKTVTHTLHDRYHASR
jgi:hypothetical protein